MHKAYDRVEWDFLNVVMEKLGFYPRWCRLIIGCISLVNFAVLLNGKLGNKSSPSQGLRQGDPLSPYFFLLINDVFSQRLQWAVERYQLEGV